MKKLSAALIVGICSLLFASNGFAGEWKQDARGWWYDNGDGTWPGGTWQWIDGDRDGTMESYYFDSAGYLKVNTRIDGYDVDGDGAWVVNQKKQTKKAEEPQSKKGIALTLPDSKTALDLGAKNIIMNNPIGAYYDRALSVLKSQGLSNTVIIFNPWENGKNAAILPTSVPQQGAVLYGFNNSEEGKKALAGVAERYAAAYGKNVDNWVIGNEINHPGRWNYVPDMGMDSYALQYAQSFRIWYDAIKRHNPNANVYIPFDYRFNWTTNQGAGVLQARPLLTALNLHLRDTDYGVAWHAYPEGLADPDFTNDANAQNSPDAKIINMNNIHVLTDFMQQESFLNPDGEVRSIILSEQGFHAVNEDIQAQMVKQAYEIAKSNPHIDIFFLSRERDLGEIHGGQEMKFGLMDSAGNKRKAYWVYKNLQ